MRIIFQKQPDKIDPFLNNIRVAVSFGKPCELLDCISPEGGSRSVCPVMLNDKKGQALSTDDKAFTH